MCTEVEEILFKLATNDHSDEAFLLISKYWLYLVDCPCTRAMFKLLYVPHRRGGGRIVFGADPIGVGVGMTLSCLHNIS